MLLALLEHDLLRTVLDRLILACLDFLLNDALALLAELRLERRLGTELVPLLLDFVLSPGWRARITIGACRKCDL